MAEIIDLDFYRKFKVALPIRQRDAEQRAGSGKPVRRHRKTRKTLSRPIYRDQTNLTEKN